VFDFAEDPRVTDGGAADHDAVYFVFGTPGGSLFDAVDVPVAKDGDCDARIPFDFADEGPVGVTFIHLGPCATMDGEGFDTDILQPFSDFIDVFRAVVPTKPRFDGDRQMGGLHHGLGHFRHFVNVL